MLFTWVTLKMDTVKVKWNLCCPIPRGSFGIFLRRYGKPMCVGYLILLISYTTSATSTLPFFLVSFVMTCFGGLSWGFHSRNCHIMITWGAKHVLSRGSIPPQIRHTHLQHQLKETLPPMFTSNSHRGNAPVIVFLQA